MQATAESSPRTPAAQPRLLATAGHRAGCALMFAVFGAGALLLAFGVIPLACLVQRAEPRDRVAQRWIQRAFRAFAALGARLGLFRIELRGGEQLAAGPALVVANHPTLLDVVFLVGQLPQADCVVKVAAWRNPFLRAVVSRAGYVPNDGGAGLVARCAERLRAGRTLVLFPEGSRSPARGLRPFTRGAARIALASGVALRPVQIRCEPRILGKDQPWWGIPSQTVQYTLSVGRDVAPAALAQDGLPEALAARRITEELQRMFRFDLETRNTNDVA
jgi:1-acyl-sn-glycerol-3-phosphate acyltransferase